MAVIVLGAGATRGASFVSPRRHPCLPPLDADFFTQLQKIQNAKHRPLVDKVIADVVGMFGRNFRITLENMFTTLEHSLKMVQTTGEKGDFTQPQLKEQRARLMQAIAAAVEESLAPAGRTPLECDYHASLVRKLRYEDTIISFNYDCVVDYTLKQYGISIWNARRGYGFKLGSHGTKLRGDDYWQPVVPAAPDRTVKLYKLHGSLHFNISEDGHVVLKQRPYTKQRKSPRFTIIPPESVKALSPEPLGDLWKAAAAALRRATTIVVIGYSLPETDMHSTALFRINVNPEHLKSLVVVNPDRAVRFRTREVLSRGISDTTRVLSFDSFADFVAVERSLWDPSA